MKVLTLVLLLVGFVQLPLVGQAAGLNSDVEFEYSGTEEGKLPPTAKPKPDGPKLPGTGGDIIKGFLPQTGEEQLVWLGILGMVLVLLAGSYYYLRKERKSNAHEKY